MDKFKEFYKKYSSQWLPYICLTLILLVAAMFRFLGLDWDERQLLHPDERFISMVTAALKFPANIIQYFDTATSPFNPHNAGFGFYVYGTFPVFFTKFISSLWGNAGYGELQILGRVLSGIVDLGTIVLTFFVGRKIASSKVGLIAAALLACVVLNIQLAHFYGMEHYSSFFIMLSLLLFILLYQRIKEQGFQADKKTLGLGIASGFTFGMALSCKINTALFIGVIILGIVLLVVSFWNISENKAKLIIRSLMVFGLFLLAAFLAFRIFQPYAFESFSLKLNPKWVSNMQEVEGQTGGKADFPPALQWVDRPWYFSFEHLTNWYFGFPFALAAWSSLLGFGVVLAKRILNRAKKFQHWTDFTKIITSLPVPHLLIWGYAVVFLLYQSQRFSRTGRYFNTTVPFLALLIAVGLLWLYRHLKEILNKRHFCPPKISAALATAPIIVILLGNFLWGCAFLSVYLRPNSRVEASRWILQNIPTGSHIGGEHWDDGLPLRVDGKDPYGNGGEVVYKGVEITTYNPPRSDDIAKLIKALTACDYYITSSNRVYASVLRLPERYPATIAFYDKLFKEEAGFTLVKTFTSYPTLFGIQFNDDKADESFTVYDHPQVHIFKKNASFDAKALSDFMLSFPEPKIWPLTTAERNKLKATESGTKSLLLSDEILDENKNTDTSKYFVLNELSQSAFSFGPLMHL